MTERKFTDEDLIKALEHCTSSTTSEACNGCPLYDTDVCIEMDNALNIYALDLINRQRAEIERLEAIIDAAEEHFNPLPFKNKFDEYIEKAKSEAIKEFAESMKKREGSNAYCCFCAHATIYGGRAKECDEPYIDKDGKEHSHCFMFSKFESYIDKLVKEMTEGEQ